MDCPFWSVSQQLMSGKWQLQKVVYRAAVHRSVFIHCVRVLILNMSFMG